MKNCISRIDIQWGFDALDLRQLPKYLGLHWWINPRWAGIRRKGLGARGFPEVSEQSDPAPVAFSAVLIVCGLLILGYGVIHLLR